MIDDKERLIELAERVVFLKAHWRKGFWNKPWFWFSFQRWPGQGFAVLICGIEFAALKARASQVEEPK